MVGDFANWGVISPLARPLASGRYKRCLLDVVGEAAEYNSARVNTLRRSQDGYKLPGSREKSRSRFRNQSGD